MYMNPRILDLGLSVLSNEATRLDICHTEPTTYAQATSAYTVGNKTSLDVGDPAARSPSGRKVTVAAITDGTVTTTSTSGANDPAFWAITDTVDSRLLLVGPIQTPKFVYTDDGFTMDAFDFGIPDLA